MTTADFTADELATLARFDATPAAPESWGGGLREKLERYIADHAATWETTFSGGNVGQVVGLPDAAFVAAKFIAAHLGQQQAAIDRVRALAEKLKLEAARLLETDPSQLVPYDRGQASCKTSAADRIRAALGADL